MADIMDKTDAFFEALGKVGIEFTGGQTAIVCKDGVVLVNVDEDEGVNAIFCNNKVEFDYELGITPEDVEQFNTVAGILEEFEKDEEE